MVLKLTNILLIFILGSCASKNKVNYNKKPIDDMVSYIAMDGLVTQAYRLGCVRGSHSIEKNSPDTHIKCVTMSQSLRNLISTNLALKMTANGFYLGCKKIHEEFEEKQNKCLQMTKEYMEKEIFKIMK